MNTDNLMREVEILEPQNLIDNDDELILYFKWKKKHQRNLPGLHVGKNAHLIFDTNCLLCKSQHFYKFKKCIQCKYFRESNCKSYFVDKNGNKELDREIITRQ